MMPRWRNLWCQFDRGRPCDRLGKRCFVATTVIVPKLWGIRLPQAPGTDHRAGAARRPSGRCRTSPSSVGGKMAATRLCPAPDAGRRARAARRPPQSSLAPACFRHRGPTVGPRPHAVPHDCCKNCCDPSVSGPGCRPSGRGHMSPSPAVGEMHVSGAGRRPSRRAGAGVAKVIFMVQHRIWMARCPAEMKGCCDEMNSSGIRTKRSFAGTK